MIILQIQPSGQAIGEPAMKSFNSVQIQQRQFLQEDLPRNTNPRAISGDWVEPDWEQRVKVTVGPQKADIVGDTDRVIQAAVDYVVKHGVTMVMVNEKTTALAMYEQGNLDFIDNHSIPALEKPKLAGQPGFKSVPQLRGYYYGFVTDRKPFDDVRVRQAFSLAVDRSVFPAILHGGEIAATSWIPPGMLAHNDKIGLGFNPEKAQALMREAGYPNGKGFPPVVLAYNTEEDHKLVAEAVQGMWQKTLGVVVKLENQEWKVYLKKLQNDPPNLFRLGWGADYPDPDNFMKLFTANSGNNNTRWKNANFDQLLEQAAQELDNDKRSKLYDQAQKILIETDAAIMPFFWSTESTLLKPRFTGLEFNSMARMDLRNVRPVKN
jgi:oligopeptide transport system substrate-binding protein